MARRVFISHAASDKPLAGLVERLLIMSGVPRDRVFYSSDRATGVPAGRGSREVLKAMLRDDPFVIEVISTTFMTRPMCLMELGAAWVMEVPTFPIVVPPLSRAEVIAQIGDVHLPRLGSEDELDELFDELHGRLLQHLEVTAQASVWNPAVRDFRRDLPQALAALDSATSQTAQPDTIGDAPSSSVPAQDDQQRLSPDLVAHKITKQAGAYSTDVLGELTNESGRDFQIVLLSATLYNATGGIVGTANGSINGLPGGQTKTFRLSSAGRVDGIATMRLQTDGQM
ncbi:toll/interleukin-1 receptor domain-containing protein [Blastococcus sp. CT_GayMR19]|uniref:FxLYD domain-containing protein n=1 Tax=Blastococcus sp. CT_GayMR19 TaxID=2559608 RepID=UPI0010749535|nr:FxLYD domain-containing protein [Blastococcus sp. CT_GayMR19]TFV79399.1 toll/interleukin-1 receptor domain-containing protein [Blastococcus sp. CT_GayMR19]